MPSPFPGMNPYLERDAVWHTFHEHFCTACVEMLVPQVRPAFLVKQDENIFIHELSAEERRLLGRADVAVAKSGQEALANSSVAVLQPPLRVQIPVAVDEERLSYVEIRDRESNSLVTVIELLSPTNKNHGPDREQFLGKRKHLLSGGVNYVEIDLMRGGPRLPLKDLPDCDYYIMVRRVDEWPHAGLWALRLRDPLPLIPIPLRPPVPDARLDLQALLHRLYDAGGYGDYIYLGKPQPPLHPTDAAWAEELISVAKQLDKL